MTNTELLREKMEQSGYKLRFIAMSAPVIKCKKTPRKKCSFVAEVKGKR